MKKFVPVYLLCLISLSLFSCSDKKLHQHKEWEDFFESNDVKGCLMLHDYYKGTFDVYGFGAIQERISPVGTFNLVLALAGLETGVITDTNMVIRDSSAHLSGLTMAQAFRTGNNSYFQWVAQKIGKNRMQYWIDSTYYGNLTVGNSMTTFWTDNTLRISPDEQMGLMERLYRNKLAFQPRSQNLAKKLLIRKTAHEDTLYYLQGVGTPKDKKTGWITGWIKKKDEPYFFVIKTLAPDSLTNLKARNLNILYKVLAAKGLVSETGRLN